MIAVILELNGSRNFLQYATLHVLFTGSLVIYITDKSGSYRLTIRFQIDRKIFKTVHIGYKSTLQAVNFSGSFQIS